MDDEKKYRNGYAYIRWSTESQSEGDSERRQKELIEKAVKLFAVPILETIVDRAVSARKDDPDLERSWRKLATMVGPGDILFTEHLDRITRRGLHRYLDLVLLILNKGAFVYLTKRQVMITLQNYEGFDFLTKAESDKTTMTEALERSKARIDEITRLKRAGIWAPMQNIPSWIISNPVSQTFEVDENMANVVRKVLDYYLSGHSYREICKKLYDDDFVPPHKYVSHRDRRVRKNIIKHWTCPTIRGWIKTRATAGYYTWEEGGIQKEILLYPPIISEEKSAQIYLRAALLKRSNKGGRQSTNPERNLFYKISFCEECGGGMSVRVPIRRGKKRRELFYCSGERKILDNGLTCNFHGIDKIMVEESFRTILQEDSVLEKFIASGTSTEPLKVDTLKMRLIKCEEKKKRLVQLFIEDDDAPKMLLETLKTLESESIRLSTEIAREEATIRASEPTLHAIKKASEQKLFEKWNDPESRRAIRELIRNIVERISMNKSDRSYTIFFKKGSASPIKPIKVELDRASYTVNGLCFDFSPHAIIQKPGPK